MAISSCTQPPKANEPAGAHYLITNDSHFSVLKSVVFPKVNVVSIEEFKASLEAK